MKLHSQAEDISSLGVLWVRCAHTLARRTSPELRSNKPGRRLRGYESTPLATGTSMDTIFANTAHAAALQGLLELAGTRFFFLLSVFVKSFRHGVLEIFKGFVLENIFMVLLSPSCRETAENAITNRRKKRQENSLFSLNFCCCHKRKSSKKRVHTYLI
jgi:hypothetical protein